MEPFYLHVGGGRRFCLHHPAAAPPRGALLFLHPFGEEMNKSRRVVAQAARALARNGWDVLLIDLLGCGDSDGDFHDATWEAWRSDGAAGLRWLQERCAQVWTWGLRAGCLLASELACEHATNLLLWQPVLTGQQALRQQLRLRSVRHALTVGGGPPDLAAAEAAAVPAESETMEVGGYRISPGLARGLAQSELLAPVNGCKAVWLEVSALDRPALSPGGAGRVERWRGSRVDVAAQAVAGPQFWQTVEIAECPALVSETVRWVDQRQ